MEKYVFKSFSYNQHVSKFDTFSTWCYRSRSWRNKKGHIQYCYVSRPPNSDFKSFPLLKINWIVWLKLAITQVVKNRHVGPRCLEKLCTVYKCIIQWKRALEAYIWCLSLNHSQCGICDHKFENQAFLRQHLFSSHGKENKVVNKCQGFRRSCPSSIGA